MAFADDMGLFVRYGLLAKKKTGYALTSMGIKVYNMRELINDGKLNKPSEDFKSIAEYNDNYDFLRENGLLDDNFIGKQHCIHQFVLDYIVFVDKHKDSLGYPES
jgi:hypothetical protein